MGKNKRKNGGRAGEKMEARKGKLRKRVRRNLRRKGGIKERSVGRQRGRQ